MRDFTSKHPKIFGLLFLAALAGAVYLGSKFIYAKMTRGRRGSDVNPPNKLTVKEIDANRDVRIDVIGSDDHSENHSDDGSCGRTENPVYYNSVFYTYNGCVFNSSPVSSSMSSELKPLDAFKRQLKALLEEQYQFSIKRSSADTLLIEFTSENEAMGSPEETIQPNLKQLIELLKSAIVEKGFKNNQYEIDIDLEKWKLTIIEKEPKVLNGIAELLERAGRPGKGISYFAPLSQVKEALFGGKRSKSVVSGSEPEPTVICLMQ